MPRHPAELLEHAHALAVGQPEPAGRPRAEQRRQPALCGRRRADTRRLAPTPRTAGRSARRPGCAPLDVGRRRSCVDHRRGRLPDGATPALLRGSRRKGSRMHTTASIADRFAGGGAGGGRRRGREVVTIWIERRAGAVWAVGRAVSLEERADGAVYADDYVFEGFEMGDALEAANEALTPTRRQPRAGATAERRRVSARRAARAARAVVLRPRAALSRRMAVTYEQHRRSWRSPAPPPASPAP